MKLVFQLLAFLLFPILVSATSSPKTVQVEFYSERISIQYDKNMILKGKKLICANDKCVNAFYKAMKAGPADQVLKQLQNHQQRMQLNDWLYAKLVRATVDEIYAKEKEIHKTKAWWYFLCASGFDIRLANYDYVDVYLYAPSNDELPDIAFFTEDDQRFYNLNALLTGENNRGRDLNKHRYKANAKGKGFSFKLDVMPNLKPQTSQKEFTFTYKEEEIQLNLTTDKTILEVLQDYPKLDEMGYLEASLSPALAGSLMPTLREMIKGKSQKESLEVLAAFTRTAFVFKWDWNVYNEDRAMFAEELFHSEFSDQEDRCALYYYLVKELLDLPILVISHFNNNMTLGVAIDEEVRREFEYKGKKYVICDPTHPTSTCEIGRYPNGLTSNTASIVGESK